MARLLLLMRDLMSREVEEVPGWKGARVTTGEGRVAGRWVLLAHCRGIANI
jgi:hypothetical protein